MFHRGSLGITSHAVFVIRCLLLVKILYQPLSLQSCAPRYMIIAMVPNFFLGLVCKRSCDECEWESEGSRGSR